MIHSETDMELRNRHGEVIHTTVTLPQQVQPADAVVLVHGFKGFRNWSFLPLLAQEAASRSLIAVRVDTSLNGMNGSNDRVLDTDAFARNHVTREVDDVHDVVTQLADHLGTRWSGTVHFVGHSRGGGVIHVVMRELAERPEAPVRLGRGVSLNGIGMWVRWTQRQRPLWIEAGYTEFTNQRTGQNLRMNVDYMYDIEQHAERIDVKTAAEALADRMLYIHAEQDVTVPLREHLALRDSASCCGPLVQLSHTTHTFGMTHPIARITEAFALASDHTFSWVCTTP
ncbi:MAG: alpha/beta fold hydrolase [Candidatus Kapabacteria bacterium]|nr:alpha/beta fold hydrolase [Candidatus Kapabacteria bacterium]